MKTESFAFDANSWHSGHSGQQLAQRAIAGTAGNSGQQRAQQATASSSWSSGRSGREYQVAVIVDFVSDDPLLACLPWRVKLRDEMVLRPQPGVDASSDVLRQHPQPVGASRVPERCDHKEGQRFAF